MPIAHLLAPQILRRAQEIDEALYPRPVAAGYLQASAPAPTASAKAMTELRAEPAPRPDTVFKNAARRAVPKQIAKGKIKQIPNAPAPAGGATGTDELVGMSEDGRPIYASEPAPKPSKKRVIKLPAGAVGENERGEAITAGGKNLGYLRGQDPNVRTLERNRMDVPLGEKNVYDPFGGQVLQQRFGGHLKAMQDNRDADGMPTDKFPLGYFDHMSKRAKEEIEAGVARLAELERGTPI